MRPGKQLTAFLVADDGSFKMLYEQAASVKYKSGTGEFAGYWVTFQIDASFPHQSAMGWTSYSCQTGYPSGKYHHIDIDWKSYEIDANPYCRRCGVPHCRDQQCHLDFKGGRQATRQGLRSIVGAVILGPRIE